jgi:hypothetical protein
MRASVSTILSGQVHHTEFRLWDPNNKVGAEIATVRRWSLDKARGQWENARRGPQSGPESRGSTGCNQACSKAVCGLGWSTLGTTVARDWVQQDWATSTLVVWGHQPSVSPTGENIYMKKGAYTWTPQKETNVEQRESFVRKQTHLSVNSNIQQHWNMLTYNLVQCDSFSKWTVAWRWPSRAKTCSNWCSFNVILN